MKVIFNWFRLWDMADSGNSIRIFMSLGQIVSPFALLHNIWWWLKFCLVNASKNVEFLSFELSWGWLLGIREFNLITAKTDNTLST